MAKGDLEKEIEEILARLDSFPAEGRLARIRRRMGRRIRRLAEGVHAGVPRVSIGSIAVAGALLLILGYFLGRFMNGPASYILIAGLVLLGIAFVLSIRGAGAGRPGYRYEKRWRGQVIDDTSGADLGRRIRHWFQRSSRKDRRR